MTERADQFSITLAQLNPTVGDVAGNAAKVRTARARAHADGADVVVLPELFIAGYPPEDLVLKPAFQSACRAAVEELARETADGGPAVLVGTPWVEDGKLYNGCALLDEGRISCPPLQIQPAELRRVRRKARVRAGPGRGSGADPRRPGRRADLRGYLARRIGRLRERRRMSRRDRRGNPGGAERLALRARQGRHSSRDFCGAGDRKRTSADLSQPDRRAGRTRVRRRLLRAQRRSVGGGAIAGIRGKHHDVALDARAKRLALPWAGRAGA